MPTGRPMVRTGKPCLARRQLSLGAFAAFALLFGVPGWSSDAGAQTPEPRREPTPPPSSGGDPRTERPSPVPGRQPRDEERRRDSTDPSGGAEIEVAPDEPAPHGCPVNDRKLELIV